MTTQLHTEPLLAFRLAYLRAIARSWQDDAYRRDLIAQRDIQPMLHQDFGLPTLWPHVDVSLHLSDDPVMRAEWKPVLAARWVCPDDAFVIVLPQAPQTHAAEALAAYYQLFPDFMGVSTSFEPQQGGASRSIPDGDPDSLLNLGRVMLRAIALAWQSPEFLAALTRDDGIDKAPVLSQWLGYNNPFNFHVRFVTDEAFTWNTASGKWNLQRADGSLIKNGIVLNYPNAPAEKEYWPIALTSYNNTGDAYPFTC